MIEQTAPTTQFFVTSPAPCPYLEGKYEQKVFTYLPPLSADAINAALTLYGFRRSQNIIYRPLCKNCQACVSVRIPVADFKPDRTMKRLYKNNADLVVSRIAPQATQEQYALFKAYVAARHRSGSMADMTFNDYSMMVHDCAVNSSLVEYRLAPSGNDAHSESKGRLIAVALSDNLPDGYSMVYSFYDTQEHRRSLGTFMILEHIRHARQKGYSYVYLGYWVKDSAKMQYKVRFKPQEHLGTSGWCIYTG